MTQQCRQRDIVISPAKGVVDVMFNGKQIAHSSHALELKEGTYPPVIYLPVADVDEKYLAPSTHTSHCPYKGDAAYYDLVDGEKTSPAAVWYYPDPCPLVARIKDHVAFWGDDITYVEET
jgi:uncharacterized protein (DUF427 family)